MFEYSRQEPTENLNMGIISKYCALKVMEIEGKEGYGTGASAQQDLLHLEAKLRKRNR